MQEKSNSRELNGVQRASFLLHYYGEWQLRKLYKRITGKKLRSEHYAGKKVLSKEEGNRNLKEMIEAGQPFMAARYGGTELSAVAEVLRSECLHKSYDFNRLKNLNNLSGFTEEGKEDYERFAHLMIESTKYCNFMGVWYNQMENWICRQYMPDGALLTHRNVYDFWHYEVPYTSALKGKKVVVIHPYSESISKQYERRKLIYENPNILPEFELRTVKAVQTLCNHKDERFLSWFDALEYMYQEAMKEEFDIALIGCGAYGYPLAARIKRANKMAIHMGGVLQILFGIKGKRWDVLPDIAGLYNEYWIRPSANETFPDREKVEQGCYW